MKNIAIILFGGNSTRFKNDVLKQFYIVNDKPLCFFSLQPFINSKNIDLIIVVTNKNHQDIFEKYLENKEYYFVDNGEQRFDSVDNALKFLKANNLADDNDNILIHDGARPLVEEKNIVDLLEALKTYNAATLAIKLEDTIAKIENDVIVDVPNRNEYVRIQTPQAFKFKTIFDNHNVKNHLASDDTQLLLKSKEKIKIVEGNKKLYKITTVEDIIYLKAMLKNE